MSVKAEVKPNSPEECFHERAVINELILHDVYELPHGEGTLTVCPQCGEVGESLDTILHERWCPYGDWAIRPGDF